MASSGPLPFVVLWLLLIFGLVLAPGADSRALTTDTVDNTHDHLVQALTNITKLMKRDVDHSCAISACDIDEDLCNNDDNDGGDDYDDDCDEDNLEDCPPEQVDTTDDTASGRREYSVTLQSGDTVLLKAMPYPSVGKGLEEGQGR